MEPKEKIYKQHEENQDWLNRLQFYNEEILILREQLEEIASKNTATGVQKEVEHFENQFKIQRNNSDELAHKIRLNEGFLLNEINKNPVGVDHRTVPSHIAEKEFIEFYEKNFNEMRQEFKQFVAKWM